eukprot:gb/GFBE01043918.1/.p1 GENE.gb/GFBE01043918.1/~~gb/GFBE01043918.1/.p1  ORF type:complete len:635 (+),score=98.80 gb/GFBE01043918.1/:1-1905(+)
MGRVLSSGDLRTPSFGLWCEDSFDLQVSRTISQDVALITGKSQHIARAALDIVGDNQQEAYALLMSDMSLTVVNGGPCELEKMEVGMAAWLGSEGVVASLGSFEGCTLLRMPRYHRGELRLFTLEPLEVFLIARGEDIVAQGWTRGEEMVCPDLSADYSGSSSAASSSLQTRVFHPGPAAIPLEKVELAMVRFIRKPGGARPPVNSRIARCPSPPSVTAIEPEAMPGTHPSGGTDSKRTASACLEGNEQTSAKYRILRHIDSGAFGAVYLAEATDGTQVAVKRIPTDGGHEMREVRLLQKVVSHPCVVSFLGCFTHAGAGGGGGEVHIIMEYLPENLHKRIDGKAMPEECVRCYSFQLLRALAHLDGLKMCHRDVKPENILLAGQSLKLADFGSAKILGEEASCSYICSRWWRAPELILGAQRYTTSVDWWSGGCVIAEMMSGKPIFTGESSWGQMYAIIRVLGTPTAAEMETLTPREGGGRLETHLRSLVKCRRGAIPWAEVLPAFAHLPAALELPSRLLAFAPGARCHPAEALLLPWLARGGTPMRVARWTEEELRACPAAKKQQLKALVTRRARPRVKREEADKHFSTYLGKRSADRAEAVCATELPRTKSIRLAGAGDISSPPLLTWILG